MGMTFAIQNLEFRGIDQVLNEVSPLFEKHNILVGRRNLIVRHDRRSVPKDRDKISNVSETFIECTYVFTSTDDGSEFTSEGFGEGQDSSGGDKSSSMATSNAYKYVIFEMFSIATEDQLDSDQVTAKELPKTSSFRKNTPQRNDGF